jgi:hypothetical protein
VTGRLGRCDGVGRGCTNLTLAETDTFVRALLNGCVVIEVKILVHKEIATTSPDRGRPHCRRQISQSQILGSFVTDGRVVNETRIRVVRARVLVRAVVGIVRVVFAATTGEKEVRGVVTGCDRS